MDKKEQLDEFKNKPIHDFDDSMLESAYLSLENNLKELLSQNDLSNETKEKLGHAMDFHNILKVQYDKTIKLTKKLRTDKIALYKELHPEEYLYDEK